MVSKERKAKFLKSKKIYNKRNLRFPGFLKKECDYDRKFIEIDNDKSKKATSKILDKLIKDKIHVQIYSSDDKKSCKGIILDYNKNYIIMIADVSEYEIGNLAIIKKVTNIIKYKNIHQHIYSDKFKIVQQQYDYFKNNDFLPMLPSDLQKKITNNLALIDLKSFKNHTIERNDDLFNFLKDKDYVLEFSITNTSDIFYGTIINVNSNNIEVRARLLNEYIFVNNILTINYDDIQYIKIDILNKKQNVLLIDYGNNNYNNKLNSVISSINENYTFGCIYDNLTYKFTIEIKDDNENSIINSKLFMNKLYYLNTNRHQVISLRNNDINIIENIEDNVNLEIGLKNIDKYSDNNLIFKLIDNNYCLFGFKILKNYNNYLLIQNNSEVNIIFKEHIENIYLDYNPINSFKYKINTNIKDLNDIINKICNIQTKYIDYFFYIVNIDNGVIYTKICYYELCLSDNIFKINVNDVIKIDIVDNYLDNLNSNYLQYKDHNLVKSYYELYKKLYELSKKYIIHDNFYIGQVVEISDSLYFDIEFSNKLENESWEIKRRNRFDLIGEPVISDL